MEVVAATDNAVSGLGGSLLDNGLRRMLLDAGSGHDGSALALSRALELAESLGERSSATLDGMSPELLLLCAETAIKLGRFEEGDRFVQTFLAAKPAANQFLVRAYYCAAQVSASHVSGCKSDELVAGLGAALEWALRGLQLASSQPAYRFLVYNGSVHIYNISRALLRPGRRHHLVGPLKAAVNALAQAAEADKAWRLQLSTQLAHAHDENGETDAALAVATAASPLAEALGADAVEALFRLQLHLCRRDGARLAKMAAESKGGVPPKLRALAQLAALGAAITAHAAATDAKKASGGADAPAAPTKGAGKGGGSGSGGGGADERLAVRRGLLDALALADPTLAAVAAAALAADPTALDPPGAPLPLPVAAGASRPEAALSEEVVVVTGQLAAQAGAFGLAAACAERTILSAHLPTRVRAQLVREAVRIGRLDLPLPQSELAAAVAAAGGSVGGAQREGGVYSQRMVATRAESLALLEETLGVARRCALPELITEVAVRMHSVALPLLQPELLPLVHRPLQLAAEALEQIDSPLSQLRAQLHAQLARCELGAEFVHKAQAQLAKGLALDVPDAAAQQRLEQSMRPLAGRLSLRADVWGEPEAAEHRAALRLERAKAAPTAKLCKAALAEAITLLEKAPAPAEGDADGLRERCLLWAEMAALGWQRRLPALTTAAASKLLALPVQPTDQPAVARAQAEAHYALVEVHVLELAQSGRAPCVRRAPAPRAAAPEQAGAATAAAAGGGKADGKRSEEASAEAEAAAARAAAAAAAEAAAATASLGESASEAVGGGASAAADAAAAEHEAATLSHLLHGMRLARLCAEPWLLINGAVHLHNHHAPALAALPPSGGALPLELLDALCAANRHLRALDPNLLDADPPSLMLACALATAQARAQLALARAGGDPRPDRPSGEEEEEEFAAAAAAQSAGGAAAAAAATAAKQATAAKGVAAAKGTPAKASAQKEKAPPAGAKQAGKGAAAVAAKAAAGASAELQEAADVLRWACALAHGQPSAKEEAVRTLVSVLHAQGAKEPWDLGPSASEPQSRAVCLFEALRLRLRTDAAALDSAEAALLLTSAADGTTAPLPSPQLWAQLAECALAMGRMPLVVSACERCVELLARRRAQAAAGTPIDPTEWRWFALAQWLHGAALAQLAAGSGHPADLVVQLRLKAAEHFALAAEHSLAAGAAAHVCRCAFALWEQLLPLARAPATRQLAAQQTRQMLATLKAAQEIDAAEGGGAGLAPPPPPPRAQEKAARRADEAAGAQAADWGAPASLAAHLDEEESAAADGTLADVSPVARLRQQMYTLLLAALSEAREFGEGLAAVEEAFALLPAPCHAELWQQRVTLMVRAGHGRLVAGEMARLRDAPADLRASVWLALARAAPSKSEGLMAFRRALGALSAEPLARADVLVEFGEWLFAHGFPPRDAEDQLLAAVDQLLDLDDEEAAGGRGRGEGGADDAASAAAADEDRSLASALPAARRGGSRSVASGASFRSTATGGVAGGLGGARSRAGTLAATSATGGSMAGRGAAQTGLGGGLGVSHFESLLRIHCMLSRMAPTAAARSELLAAALSYLARMWRASAHCASVREAKGAALAKLAAAPNAAEAKAIKQAPLVPGAHGARVHSVPSEPSEWLGWVPSAELLEAMAADRRNGAMNQRSIRRPGLTLHFLQAALHSLQQEGQLVEQALVLQSMQFLAQHVLPHSADGALAGPALAALAMRRRASLCERLGLGAQAAAVRSLAPPAALSADEVLAARAEGEALAKARAAKAQTATPLPAAPGGDASGTAADEAADAEAAARLPAPPHVWLQLGEQLLAEGDWAAAHDFLAEARAYALSTGDERRAAWAEHALASILFARGEARQAADAEADAQRRAIGARASVEFWAASAAALARYVDAAANEIDSSAGSEPADAAVAAAVRVLSECQRALLAFGERRAESAVDARLAAAHLLAAIGEAHAAQAHRVRARAAEEQLYAPPSAPAVAGAARAAGLDGALAELSAARSAAAAVQQGTRTLLEAAQAFSELGAHTEHARSLVAAAQLIAHFPLPPASGSAAAESAPLAGRGEGEGEVEASLLAMHAALATAAELGAQAQASAEKVRFFATTQLTPEPIRTPAESLLGACARCRAEVEVRRARLQLLLEDLRALSHAPHFPRRAPSQRDEAEAAQLEQAVQAFLTPPDAFARDPSYARRAAALAANAVGLCGASPAAEGAALLVQGAALATLARVEGELEDAWQPAATGEAAGESDEPPPPLPPMVARGAAALRRAQALARAGGDVGTEGKAAAELANLLGIARPEETAAALALAHSCDVCAAATALWEATAEPACAERARHRHRAALRDLANQPTAAAAARALERSLFEQSPAWRALRVPPSPLHALLGVRSEADEAVAAAGGEDALDELLSASAQQPPAAPGKGGGAAKAKGGAAADAQAAAAAEAAATAATAMRGCLPAGSNVRVLQLSLSAERTHLFALAVAAPPPAGAGAAAAAAGKQPAATPAAKPSSAGTKAAAPAPQPPPPPAARVAVCRVAVDAEALAEALHGAAELREMLESIRLSRAPDAKPTAAASAATAARRMSTTLRRMSTTSAATAAAASELGRESSAGAAAEGALGALLAATERLIGPALAQLSAVLAPSPDELAAAGAAAGGGEGSARTHLVLCADEALAALPLEGLAACSAPHVGSCCRDFSLAFVARRLGALSRAPDGGISKARLGYCVDPLAESAEVREVLSGALLGEKAAVPWAAAGKAAWVAQLDGSAAVPAAGDWQTALERSSLFTYCGLGKLLAYAPPSSLAGLSLDGLGLALLCDRVQTEASIRRQGKLDNKKGPRALLLETPYRTALLLACRGTLAVVLNQWASTADDNRALLVGTLTALGAGAHVGDAVATAAGRASLVEGLQADVLTEVAAGSVRTDAPGTTAATPATVQPPPPPRRCSMLCPVVYGSPLVHMGGEAPPIAAGKASAKGNKK